MKAILTALLLSGCLYLTSCSNNDNNNNLYVIPKADSVTKGGYLQLSFAGKTFMIYDLAVKNIPVYSLYAKTQATDVNDTLWIAQLQMTDHESKTISMNLTLYNNTSGASIGTYMITTNTSTVTDFTGGENKVYAVSLGSSADITNTNFTTEGTLTLNLYFNGTTYPATGSFKIYN